jgi:hypothetical protein
MLLHLKNLAWSIFDYRCCYEWVLAVHSGFFSGVTVTKPIAANFSLLANLLSSDLAVRAALAQLYKF